MRSQTTYYALRKSTSISIMATTLKSRSTLFVLLLLAFFLFPFGWLATVWPRFDQWFDTTFSSAAAHIISHAVIFFIIGTAVLLVNPKLRKRPLQFFTFILFLGSVQEVLQLLSFKQRAFGWNDGFDLMVDLLGAGVAFIVYKQCQARGETQ